GVSRPGWLVEPCAMRLQPRIGSCPTEGAPMLAHHPPDPPSVGPYLLHARLGENSSARVYLSSVPGAEPVAVKVVRPEYTTDANFRAAFRRLVEEAHELDSP